MLRDVNLPAGLPSHGGNTGSNPVGDANHINDLCRIATKLPKNFPKR
jgi:hypothetical protein